MNFQGMGSWHPSRLHCRHKNGLSYCVHTRIGLLQNTFCRAYSMVSTQVLKGVAICERPRRIYAVIRSRTSKDHDIMHLLHCLSFMEARCEFFLSAKYIPGSCNELADDLSRNRLSSFLQKALNMSLKPTTIPQPLRELLLIQKPDWLSPSWTQLFNSILREDQRLPLARHTTVV